MVIKCKLSGKTASQVINLEYLAREIASLSDDNVTSVIGER